MPHHSISLCDRFEKVVPPSEVNMVECEVNFIHHIKATGYTNAHTFHLHRGGAILMAIWERRTNFICWLENDVIIYLTSFFQIYAGS